MTEYTMRDEGGAEETIDAASMEEACAAAREWLTEGDWNEPESTIWVRAWVSSSDEDEPDERVTVAIDPDEPDCPEHAEHDWQSPHRLVGGIAENPGCWGKGGGIVMTECCMHCGCARITDTWAQDPDTGEQGLTSIRYEIGRWSGEELDGAAQ